MATLIVPALTMCNQQTAISSHHLLGGCTRGTMLKALDCRIVITLVQTPVVQLHLLSDKYPWESYEPPHPSNYGLNSINAFLLEGWLWH